MGKKSSTATYRVETLAFHADVPDSMKVEPFDPTIKGYGYNGDGDDFIGMDPDLQPEVVAIESDTLEGLYATWLEYAIGCSHIQGADDDHYDYWPANYSALVHLGQQVDQLRKSERCLIIARMLWDMVVFADWKCQSPLPAKGETEAYFASEIAPRP